MNREQAEKLLAALIFNDLDETSKAELTAYLQTDDELRYRLADLRMAVKLADDAVNEGPDPVLGEQRLKQLKRLAKADKPKGRVFQHPHFMAVAAAITVTLVLLGVSMPVIQNFGGGARAVRGTASVASLEERPDEVGYYMGTPPAQSRPAARSRAMVERLVPPPVASAPASRPATRAAPSKPASPGIRSYARNVEPGGSGMGGMASDRKDSSGMSGMMEDTDGDMAGKRIAAAYGTSERNRDMYLGVKVLDQQAAASDAPATSQPAVRPVTPTAPAGGFMLFQRRPADRESVSKEAQLPPTAMATAQSGGAQAGKEVVNQQVAVADPAASLTRTPGESDTAYRTRAAQVRSQQMALRAQQQVARAQLGQETKPGAHLDAESLTKLKVEQEAVLAQTLRDRATVTVPQSRESLGRGLSDKEVDAGSGIYQGSRQEVAAAAPARTNGLVNIAGATHADGVVNYPWSGAVSPQKPGVPIVTPAPSAPVAIDVKKSDQLSAIAPTEQSQNRVPVLGDVPLVGGLFRQTADADVPSKEVAQDDSSIRGIADMPAVQVQTEVAPLATGLTDFTAKAKTEQNAPSPGTVRWDSITSLEDTAALASSSHFKVVPVNPWVLTEQDALSTFGLDVDTASYALCQRYIRSGCLPPLGAVRMEEFINAFDYAYPQRDDQPFTVHAEGAPAPFAPVGQDLTLLKVAVKARNVGRDQRRAAHLVFVVDASASMGQADRLPLVQSVANQLVDKLSDADRVSLITCANDARLHLDTVSARQKDTIRATISAIQPSGPTNLLAGLKLGYEMARKSFVAGQTNQVVLCSDGVANVGQTEAEAVLQEVAEDRKQAITLTCVGVGYGAYNDAFLEALANQGDGRYVFLDSSEQAQEALVGQLAASLQNVAQDARIQVQFNPHRVRRYRLIGYENRDIEDQRFRDDTVDAGAVGSGQCSTALYELELVGPRESGMGVPPMQHRRDADATTSRGQAARDTEEANLGIVFVRYRNVETGQMEEISRPLADSIVQRRSVEEAPRFFLAAGAARFAEWLRQSEHAQNTALGDVQRLLDQVSTALPLDRDVRDLATLAHQAEGLPRAPEAAMP